MDSGCECQNPKQCNPCENIAALSESTAVISILTPVNQEFLGLSFVTASIVTRGDDKFLA